VIFIKYLLFVAKISDFQTKRNADLVLTGIVLGRVEMAPPSFLCFDMNIGLGEKCQGCVPVVV
jgi:hypothetical protein